MKQLIVATLGLFLMWGAEAGPLTSSDGYLKGNESAAPQPGGGPASVDSVGQIPEYQSSAGNLEKILDTPEATNKYKAERIQSLPIWSVVDKEFAGLVPEDLEGAIGTESGRDNLKALAKKALAWVEFTAKSAVGSANGGGKCFQKDEWFCTDVLTYSSDFGGVGLGLNEENQALKIRAWKMQLGLSENWKLPFNIYMADVASTAGAEQANLTKLLDTEQGRLNLALAYVAKVRAWELCRFTDRGGKGCYIGIEGGARYTEFESVDQNTGDDDKRGAAGGYVNVGLNALFPLFDEKGVGEKGTLAVGGRFVYYHQNIGNSTVLFPKATDANGNLIAFDEEYQAFSFSMELNVTDEFVVSLAIYEPQSNAQLSSMTAFEFKYVPK